eukprot:2678774-Prymnesium_polylepis.1
MEAGAGSGSAARRAPSRRAVCVQEEAENSTSTTRWRRTNVLWLAFVRYASVVAASGISPEKTGAAVRLAGVRQPQHKQRYCGQRHVPAYPSEFETHSHCDSQQLTLVSPVLDGVRSRATRGPLYVAQHMPPPTTPCPTCGQTFFPCKRTFPTRPHCHLTRGAAGRASF